MYTVLFLCNTNSARSIMAEALLNHEGKELFKAYSAGIHPSENVSPEVISLLKSIGLPTDNLRSKHYSEFQTEDAPKIDFVITLCDKTHGENCPIWPGHTVTAYWGIDKIDPPHPSTLHEDLHYLENRIRLFTSLPLDKLEHLKRQTIINELA